jgi:formylglycine-generating enzyme required for sulfatase activity
MADVRSRAIVLLATMVVACTIGGLPPQPNQDAATGVGGAGGRSIGANADAANIGPGIEGGTNSGGAGTMGGTGKGGVLGGTGGAAVSGGTTTTGGTTASGGMTSVGGTKTAGGTTAAGGTSSAGGTKTTGGTPGSGGTSSGGTSLYAGTPPSCSGLAATCGPSGNESCCTSLLVPGGTFYRSYDGVDFTDKSYPATVDSFYLDKYEITVGRFRQFVNQGMGTQTRPPSAGDGAHPGITGSGWDSTWKTNLAANTAALTTNLKCWAGYQTWTDTAGNNESMPVNCLDWYTAFAFCAWDGGRLPTEAEWNYAAAGGNEQRYYPWSDPPTSTTVSDSYAVYNCDGLCIPLNVGSKSPTGDGKWGQSDLAGNVWEWTLDWYHTYQTPCNNCADITDASASSRVVRGGGFGYSASGLRSAYRYGGSPWVDFNLGARCARSSL